MSADQALVIGIWLGGGIVLTLEHVMFPLALWVAASISRRQHRGP